MQKQTLSTTKTYKILQRFTKTLSTGSEQPILSDIKTRAEGESLYIR
jgi:hypothetical protein